MQGQQYSSYTYYGYTTSQTI